VVHLDLLDFFLKLIFSIFFCLNLIFFWFYFNYVNIELFDNPNSLDVFFFSFFYVSLFIVVAFLMVLFKFAI
jgi:hypothetical protein